jgi:hypothetical protein
MSHRADTLPAADGNAQNAACPRRRSKSYKTRGQAQKPASAAFRGNFTKFRAASAEFHAASAEFHAGAAEFHAASAEFHAGAAELHASAAESRTGAAELRGSDAESRLPAASARVSRLNNPQPRRPTSLGGLRPNRRGRIARERTDQNRGRAAGASGESFETEDAHERAQASGATCNLQL